MRLDVYLSEKGLAKSREIAKRLICEGGVTVNGENISKPSKEVSESDRIELCAPLPKYVGRGGLKLEKALACFGISVKGLICLDIGASTGGFTDCMLQNGAKYVYALDVGHGQLDKSLACDERVCNMEGRNIRDISADLFDRPVEFIACDVSFISLTKVIPKITELLLPFGKAVMLVKPQFECGKSDIGKNGIVRSEKVHKRVLDEIISFCRASSLSVIAADFSPIQGGDGNIEYLILAGKNLSEDKHIDSAGIVKTARCSLSRLDKKGM